MRLFWFLIYNRSAFSAWRSRLSRFAHLFPSLINSVWFVKRLFPLTIIINANITTSFFHVLRKSLWKVWYSLREKNFYSYKQTFLVLVINTGYLYACERGLVHVYVCAYNIIFRTSERNWNALWRAAAVSSLAFANSEEAIQPSQTNTSARFKNIVCLDTFQCTDNQLKLSPVPVNYSVLRMGSDDVTVFVFA